MCECACSECCDWFVDRCYNEVVLDLVDPLDSKVCVYSGHLCTQHMSGMQHPNCPPVHISTNHSSLSTCMHYILDLDGLGRYRYKKIFELRSVTN